MNLLCSSKMLLAVCLSTLAIKATTYGGTPGRGTWMVYARIYEFKDMVSEEEKTGKYS